jgi:membrane protease YdiL (CAAX protease family)
LGLNSNNSGSACQKDCCSAAQILVPSIPLSVAGSLVVVTLCAGVFEELFFTGTVLSYLDLYLPFSVSSIGKGILFSLAHIYAYVVLTQSTLPLMAGAFLGAMIFGIGTAYLGKHYGIETSIASHVFFNFIVFNTAYHLLAIAP